MANPLAVKVMDRAIGVRLVRLGRVGEVYAAGGWIERQVVGAAERLAVGLGRGRLELLAGGIQMQESVPAGVADQVRAVGQDLVTIRRAGLGPGRCLAVLGHLGHDLLVREIQVALVVDDHPFGVVARPDHLDRLDRALRR